MSFVTKAKELMDELNRTHSFDIHKVRTELEEPVYDQLRKTYGAFYKAFWNTITIPKDAPNTIMLVERRPHPNMEFVLQNAVYFCSKSSHPFSLTVVCSDENEDYVKEILGKHALTTHIIPYFKGIGTRDQGRDEYNKAFKSLSFWANLKADYVLSIQTDSYLLRPLPDVFWTYDYIACPWVWKPGFVGGGGLTWRKKEVVVRIIEHMGQREYFDGEDCFFSQGCAELQVKTPEFEEANEYFVESCLTDTPIGVHQWWTYWFSLDNQDDQEYFMKQYFSLEHTTD